jgi:hypothetical protein
MAITGNSGRPIGLPKTGGRKKGTPNRATLTLQERLEAVDCDPLLELARIAMNANNPIEIRVRCFSEIAPYVDPKRKPVEISTDQPAVINVYTAIDPGGSNGGDQPKPGS